MKNLALFSLAAAAACLAFTAPGFARSQYGANPPAGSATVDSNGGQQEATMMVPAEANLVKALDARRAQAGNQFTAKLAQTVHLKDGPELPRGTTLIGTVGTDDMQLSGSSKLALQITEAKLKDGKAIPIKATIVGIAPSGTPEYGDSNPWTPHTLQVDQIGAMSNVDLHSRVNGKNSGVFVTTTKSDVKLGAGSEIMLAIAPQQNLAGGL